MKVYNLIEEIHSACSELWAHRALLLQRGIREDDLPKKQDLRALALLLDHDRRSLFEELQEHWQALLDRGLVTSEIQEASTPLLRLMSIVLPHISEVDTVWEMLSENHEGFPEPSQEIFRSVNAISRAYWGQPLDIQFQGRDIDRLLITCDQVFGYQDALLISDSGRLAGSVNLIADNGTIRFVLLTRDGNTFSKKITISLASSVEEIFS